MTKYIKLKTYLAKLVSMGCKDAHRRKMNISLWLTPNDKPFSIVEPQERNSSGELLCDKDLVEDSLKTVRDLIDQQTVAACGSHRLNAQRAPDGTE